MPALTCPVYIVTGARAAGKTQLLRTLISQLDVAERCAVLLNDVGATPLEDGKPLATEGVTVRHVTGCVCCSAQVALRTTLVATVRTVRPDRVLIEASAAAEPSSIASVLAERGLNEAVQLRAIVAALTPEHLLDRRYSDQPLYRQQLLAADALVLRDAPAAQRNAAAEALRRMEIRAPVWNSDALSFAALDQLRA